MHRVQNSFEESSEFVDSERFLRNDLQRSSFGNMSEDGMIRVIDSEAKYFEDDERMTNALKHKKILKSHF